jgi:hypothetical protein
MSRSRHRYLLFLTSWGSGQASLSLQRWHSSWSVLCWIRNRSASMPRTESSRALLPLTIWSSMTTWALSA